MAVHGDGARVHVVEAHEQVDERGLAAARGTHDGHALARPHVQLEVADERVARHVGEVDVRDVNLAAYVRKLEGVGRVRLLLTLVEQLEEARRAGKGVLELRDHLGDVVEGLRVLVGIAEKCREAADGKRPIDGRERTEDAHACIDERVHEARRGVDERRVEDGAEARLCEAIVDLLEAALGNILGVEGLHHALAAHVLLDEGRELAPPRALVMEVGVAPARDGLGSHDRERRHGRHDERHERVQREHEREREHDGEHAREELLEGHDEAVGELVDVSDDAVHNVAVAVRVEV